MSTEANQKDSETHSLDRFLSDLDIPENEDSEVEASADEAEGTNPAAGNIAPGLARARSFVECFDEVAPLALNPDSSDIISSLSQRADTLYRFTRELSSRLELDDTDLSDRYVIRRIAIQLSRLTPSLIQAGISVDDLYGTMQGIHAGVANDDDLDLIGRADRSEDDLVNIRLGLLRPTLRLLQLAGLPGLPESTKDQAAGWLNTQAVALAQDLAVNWDKHATLHDREFIFAAAIELCGLICVEAWSEALVEQLNNRLLPSIDPESLWAYAPMTRAAISERSMGHEDHPDASLSLLKTAFCSLWSEYIKAGPWEAIEHGPLKAACRNAAMSALDQHTAFAWNDAADSVYTKVAGFSEEEFEKWAKSDEGSKPMAFSAFVEQFTKTHDEFEFLLSAVNIDYEGLSRATKSKLAIAWGYSNAVCELKPND